MTALVTGTLEIERKVGRKVRRRAAVSFLVFALPLCFGLAAGSAAFAPSTSATPAVTRAQIGGIPGACNTVVNQLGSLPNNGGGGLGTAIDAALQACRQVGQITQQICNDLRTRLGELVAQFPGNIGGNVIAQAVSAVLRLCDGTSGETGSPPPPGGGGPGGGGPGGGGPGETPPPAQQPPVVPQPTPQVQNELIQQPQPAPAVLANNLVRTGADVLRTVAIAGALTLVGFALVATNRRRRPTQG